MGTLTKKLDAFIDASIATFHKTGKREFTCRVSITDLGRKKAGEKFVKECLNEVGNLKMVVVYRDDIKAFLLGRMVAFATKSFVNTTTSIWLKRQAFTTC